MAIESLHLSESGDETSSQIMKGRRYNNPSVPIAPP